MVKTTGKNRLTSVPHLASFHHRDYRNMWVAHMFSGAAMWTYLVSASWLVLKASDSSGWVGLLHFASMLPYLVVSPIGGLLADRLERRNLVLLTMGLSTVVAAMLVVLVLTDIVEVWHVVLLTFAAGVVRSTLEPAVMALIPNQVPKEDLLNAITLNAITLHGARFFGLAVAAPLLAVDFIGVDGVLILTAGLYTAGTAVMTRCGTRSLGEREPEQGVLRGMFEGLTYIYTHKTIALFIMLVAFHCALVMSFESILPIFSEEQLGAEDGSYLGYLVMGFGLGALIGTFLLAGVRSEALKGQCLLWTGLAGGVAPILMALMGNVIPAVVFATAMGAFQASFMALSSVFVLSISPDRLRGRISSLYVLHAGGIMAFANLGYGFVADAFSAPPIFIVTGVLFVVVMIALGANQPVLRRVYRTGSLVGA